MRVIIADCDHANFNEENKVFDKNSITYELLQCKTEQDLIDQCKGGEVFITQYGKFSRRVLEALSPEIKQIVRYGVGVDTIDLEAATEFGVSVCNVPDYGMNEVADQAVAFMMSLVRKVSIMNNYTKSTEWNFIHSMPVYRIPGKTVGIIGLGRIGKTFAKRMQGFGVNLIGYDIAYKEGDEVENAKIVDFDTLIKTSDIISVHTPLDEATRNLIDKKVLDKMKNTAYLINVSRGGIVNEADLYEALRDKKIAGAALDVVEQEPMTPDSRLFTFDNFLCSPHMAWYSEESALELKRKVAEEASRMVKGEELLYKLN